MTAKLLAYVLISGLSVLAWPAYAEKQPSPPTPGIDAVPFGTLLSANQIAPDVPAPVILVPVETKTGFGSDATTPAPDSAPAVSMPPVLPQTVAEPAPPLDKKMSRPPKQLPKLVRKKKTEEPIEEKSVDIIQPALAAPDAQPVDGGAKDEFKAALANVYANHPQLKAQREALKATDETVAQAVSGFRPTVLGEYSQGRERTEINQSGTVITDPKTKTLDVVQPVFNGGGTLASFISAKDRVKAGRAQLTALEQQVLLQAVVAYTDVVNKQAVLEVNQNNVDLLTQQLKATKARFEVGELTRTDVAQSQSRLSSAQAAERQALGDLESSRATFRRTIGYDPPTALTLPPLPTILPQSLSDAAELAQANEPTLEAARHLEKAAASDVNIRASTLLPNVNVEGIVQRANEPVPGEFRDSSNSLMVNVVVPLYQSGSEWSQLRAARNQAQQAKFNTFDTKDAVIESVTRAWQDYNTAKAVIASNEEAVRAAKIALQGIREENQYGVRTILDVLNTQQDMFTAQVTLINARVGEKQVAYRLLAAVGKLTAADLNLPVNLNNPKQHYDEVKYKLIGF